MEEKRNLQRLALKNGLTASAFIRQTLLQAEAC